MTKQTKDSIKALLISRDDAVIRGLQVIFALQTATEQVVGCTNTPNGVGFSKAHDEFATSLVKFYQKRGFLSPKQMAAARKLMQRYAGQLAKVANGEIANPLKPVLPKAAVAEETPEELEARIEREAIQAIEDDTDAAAKAAEALDHEPTGELVYDYTNKLVW
jgi:hypothetical protein